MIVRAGRVLFILFELRGLCSDPRCPFGEAVASRRGQRLPVPVAKLVREHRFASTTLKPPSEAAPGFWCGASSPCPFPPSALPAALYLDPRFERNPPPLARAGALGGTWPAQGQEELLRGWVWEAGKGKPAKSSLQLTAGTLPARRTSAETWQAWGDTGSRGEGWGDHA